MFEARLCDLKAKKDSLTDYQLIEEIVKLIDDGCQKKLIYTTIGMGHTKFFTLLQKYKSNELIDDKDVKKTDGELRVRIKELILENKNRNEIIKELKIGRRRLYRLLDTLKQDEDLKDYFKNIKSVEITEPEDIKHNIEKESNCTTNRIEPISEILDRNKKRAHTLEEKLLSYYDKVISVWQVCKELNITIEEFNTLVVNIEKTNRLNGVKVDTNIKDNKDEFTLRDKINYANLTYGFKSWNFISKDELKNYLNCDKL